MNLSKTEKSNNKIDFQCDSINLIKSFNIEWFIFSDGEPNTIKNVKSAVNDILPDVKLNELQNVVLLPDGQDYEKHLLSSGYENIIIEAIEKTTYNGHGFQDFVIRSNKVNKPDSIKGALQIYQYKLDHYPGGKSSAVYDCCYNNKAKYAGYIAEAIVSQDDKKSRIPPKVKELFESIRVRLHIDCSKEYRDE